MNRILCPVLNVVVTVIAVIFLAGFAAGDARAQKTANLSGTLLDPSGSAIPGASVSIVPRASPASSAGVLRAASDDAGHFSFTLQPGRHRLSVSHRSFMRRELEVTLAEGETRELELRLQLERLSETVVVSAEAQPLPADSSPAPVTVISGAEIAARQSTSLAALLVNVTGVSIARSGRIGGITSLFVDGGNSGYTKVLIDGTPVNEPGGAIDLSNFSLDHIAKIEVVRGAESALYGSDAMAGVIQLFTARGSSRTPRLDLLAEGGGFSSARGQAIFSGILRRFDYSVSAGRFDTEGPGVNNDSRNLTLSGNFGWHFADANSARLVLRSNTSDAGVAGQMLLTPPNLDQHNALHNFSSNASWEYQPGQHWRNHLSTTESYTHQIFSNALADFFISPDPFGICAGQPLSPHAVASQFCDFTFLTRNQYNRAGFQEQASYVFRNGAITAGYEYEVENAALGFQNGRHLRRNNQAGYLDARYQYGRRLLVHAGARAEANANFGTRVVPQAGFAYAARLGHDFWGATRLRLSYGQGIKEPRFDQNFSTDPCDPGNPNLRPERSRTFHTGIEQTLAGERVRLSADLFYNRYYDMISFGPAAGPSPSCQFGSYTFFNTDLARARGINANLEVKPLRWLRIAAGYTADDSRVLLALGAFKDSTQFAGNRLIRRPVHSGNLLVSAGYRGWSSNFSGYFSGHRTDSDFLGLGLTRNPGYARFDLATSYEVTRRVTAFGRVENLFDHRYQEIIGFPALGRDFRVGMKFILGGE
jgi:outer membrane cobalamin receptor